MVKYSTKVNFLPEEGKIFVDRSALTWVASGRYENWYDCPAGVARLKKLTAFNDLFDRRGGVLSAPGVLYEIERQVNFFNSLNSRSEAYMVDRWCEEWKRTYDILKNGTDSHDFNFSVKNRERVKFFVDKFPRVGVRDAELVRSALLSGDNCGVLTADMPMYKAYRKGVSSEKLEGCFGCNAISSKTKFFSPYSKFS